jgi:hypothetical protein
MPGLDKQFGAERQGYLTIPVLVFATNITSEDGSPGRQ